MINQKIVINDRKLWIVLKNTVGEEYINLFAEDVLRDALKDQLDRRKKEDMKIKNS
ncbi:MAG: hypothetical protein L6408_00705 [Nanoarchaeota archaeon]|nr:hypothetical protein [Nanoarchaeota archaeon]